MATKDILKACTEMAEELPLVHTTRCEWLMSLVKAEAIDPRKCKVFKEPLIYLFYGRPAYRSKKGRRPNEGIHLCPVCFVFKTGSASRKACRIFPCDSGAIADGVFGPKLKRKDIPNLDLGTHIESTRKLVAYFFGTNANYYVGRIRRDLPKHGGDASVRWYRLNLNKKPMKGDDRKSAIEVQVREKLSLKNNLLYVVLPREFLEEVAIRKKILFEWKCEAIPYPTIAGAPPTEGYALLRNELGRRLSEGTRL